MVVFCRLLAFPDVSETEEAVISGSDDTFGAMLANRNEGEDKEDKLVTFGAIVISFDRAFKTGCEAGLVVTGSLDKIALCGSLDFGEVV